MAMKVSVILVLVAFVAMSASNSEALEDSTRHLVEAAANPFDDRSVAVGVNAAFGRKLLQSCWAKVADKQPCVDGWTLYCCDGDGSDATCLGPADNRLRCSAQFDGAHTANWCKNNSC